jgi:predicted nuclease of restriction endonuclease-like (RecB) superfamily
MDKDKPAFISRDGMIADKDYVKWLADIKQRFQHCQLKTSVRINTAMLEFYWSIGRDLVNLRVEERWGDKVVKQFSLDMRNTFPNETGFSHSNVKYMKQWYSFYYERVVIGQQLIGQLVSSPKEQSYAGFFDMPESFGMVPWGHHISIISKCKTIDEAWFYINKTIEEGWSRSRLECQLENNLYKSQGAAITNFDNTLPNPQNQLAKELLKDKYNLDFLSAEAIREEKDLENELAKNITQFLLELGKGFAYVGRQMELRIDDESVFFPDLVFYHIPQKRYVIIELKAAKFIPEFAGKLNFYVTAADKLLRTEEQNPSVGLLICKTAKQTIVEWSLQDINKPLGVATYQLQEVVDRTIAEVKQRRKEHK